MTGAVIMHCRDERQFSVVEQLLDTVANARIVERFRGSGGAFTNAFAWQSPSAAVALPWVDFCLPCSQRNSAKFGRLAVASLTEMLLAGRLGPPRVLGRLSECHRAVQMQPPAGGIGQPGL